MEWHADERAARDEARRERRPLLIAFRADWDAVSLAQDRELWTDPRVVAAAKRFVAVRIDVSDVEALTPQAYAERYDVKVVPTILLLDPEGKPSTRLEGTVDIPDLVQALQSVE